VKFRHGNPIQVQVLKQRNSFHVLQ